MKYWQSFKTRMDHTANHLLTAGTPGYSSVTLICLTVVVTVILNCLNKSKEHSKGFEVDNIDAALSE